MGFSLFNTVGLLTKEWGDKRFNASSYQCLNASRHLLLQGMIQKLVIDILFGFIRKRIWISENLVPL